MHKFIVALAVVAFFAGCKKKKPGEEPDPTASYDQHTMFENYSSNLIIPAYQLMKVKLDSLDYTIQNFNSSSTIGNLALVRSAFMSAYKQSMYISTYEFGPAAAHLVRTGIHIFPTDTTQINNNISMGSYDLDGASQTDAIGFPALDFLLYGKNKTDAGIVNLFSTTPNRKQYLQDVCSNMRSRINPVVAEWASYAPTFNTATGNAAGNSLSNLVNELNYDYEISKNARVGIPLGKQTLGIAIPEKCEALYSTRSLLLLTEKVKALENIYLGRSQSGSDGEGLDNYLDFIGAQHGSESLNSAIKARFTELKNLIALVPGPLASDVVSNPAPVEAVYAKFQELLVLLKTDMPSALSVYITYVDGDGD